MYLDSAIIVKLLVPEPDSTFFAKALSGSLLSCSELALAEVSSALCAKERQRLISSKHREAAMKLLGERVERKELRLHALDSFVLQKAARLLELCHPEAPLRTFDAVHAATCDITQDFPLCTTDNRLRRAAALLRIPLFPETGAN